MFTKGYKISLQALRVNAGYSVAEIAKLLKVSEETVEAWENYSSSPTIEQAKELAFFYMVDIEDLTYGKFKTAKQIIRRNWDILKNDTIPDSDLPVFDEVGEIIGHRKHKLGKLIRI